MQIYEMIFPNTASQMYMHKNFMQTYLVNTVRNHEMSQHLCFADNILITFHF